MTVSDSGGLYVHLPWCVRKCPYCDFNSHERAADTDMYRYVDALLADLDSELARSPFVPTSVFIGGGTPSLFPGDAIARLLDGIAGRTAIADDAEITLEANPGAADAQRFREYRDAGVNRLSIGVQSFDDAKLGLLGRVHDARAAREAIVSARDAGFDNLNLDLMFGLPGDAPGDCLVDLDRALAFEPEHVSWYQLTIEQGTAFARRPPELPPHDQICDDYDAGLEKLAAAGFDHYEISAHARRGKAARHNLNYWHFGDYLGIGAGAHGKRRIGGQIVRSAKVRSPARYLATALAGTALEREDVIDGPLLASEFMLNALRLSEGFDLGEFERRTGLSRELLAAPLGSAVERGLLEYAGNDSVAPTRLGFRFLNDLQLLFIDFAAPDVADA